MSIRRELLVVVVGALILLCVACATGPVRVPARANDPNTKLVERIWYEPLPSRWQQSGWYRPTVDVGTPSRVVISVDGSACIMDDAVDEPLANEYYACPTPWRMQRHF